MRSRKDYARPRWLAAWHLAATIPAGRSPPDSPGRAGWRKRRYGKPGFSSLHSTDSCRRPGVRKTLSRRVKQALLLEMPRSETFEFDGEAPPQFLGRRRNLAIQQRLQLQRV